MTLPEMDKIKSDIEVLKNDVSHIKKMLDSNFAEFKKHVDTAQPYREKVNLVDGLTKSFNEHVLADRWCFGVIISLLVAILTKGMKVW